MAPRGRTRKKVAGNTRMDAALDAMRQYGFEENLVRETVGELLDVYEGSQGWPFIEEVSYKLLIETLLAKPQSPEQEKKKEDTLLDNAGRDDEVAETSSAATFTTGITEVCSPSLVNHDTLLLHSSGGLDSASQTNDQDPPSPCNQATDVKDSTVPAEGGGHEQGNRVEYQNPLNPVDNVNGINHTTKIFSNVEGTFVRTTMIEFPETIENLPQQRRKPCYGWIDDDNDEKVELMCFPIPPLPEHIEKLIGQSVVAPQSGRRRQRRKSRWDEKPNDI